MRDRLLEPLQSECAGSPLEPFHGTSKGATRYVIRGLVCALRARMDPHGQVLAPERVKSGQASLRSAKNCSFRVNCIPKISVRARCPEAP